MNLILSANETKLKEWTFIDRDNGLIFNNNVVVTDKRFIYQKELSNSYLQRTVSRYDVGLANIKGVNAFYGSRQSLFWLILGLIGIIGILLGVLMIATEEIEMGIITCIIGLALAVGGFYIHTHPEKSPIKIKKPNFFIKLETKTPEGSKYSLGAGQNVILRGKRPYNLAILILLTFWGIIPGVIYYFIKTKNGSDGLEMPEDLAIEVIETLGSLIF